MATCLPAAQPLALEIFGLKLFGDKEDPSRDAIPDALEYETSFTVNGGDSELEEALRSASVLLTRADEPPSGSVGLLARARSERQQLVAALYSQGYYGGTIDVRVRGRPIDDIAADADLDNGSPVPVAVVVDSGPQFTFGQTSIAVETADGARENLEPDAYGLTQGAVAKSAIILNAEETIITEWRERGYPVVDVADRDVSADHSRTRLDVAITISAGRKATFGDVSVEGAESVNTDIIVQQASIPRGEHYDPRVLRAAENRIRELGVFSSVRIEEAEELAPDGTIPLIVQVSERKHRVIGAGAVWSSTEGLSLETYWIHRNLFGGAERFRVDAFVGRIGNGSISEDIDYGAKVTFAKPGVFGPLNEFVAEAGVIHERPDSYRRLAVFGEVGLKRQIRQHLTGKIGLSGEYSRTDDAFGRRYHLLFGLPIELAYDNRDNPLDPTKGYRAVVFAEPLTDFRQDSSFVQFQGSLQTYFALDKARRFVLAGRVAAGTIAGSSLGGVPADRRFYAGGGGSVRGYGYQNISPRLPNGELTGGLSKLEASAEFRARVTEKFAVVPFVDAGTVSTDSFPGNTGWKVGVGLGLRYHTGIGPLRFDFAVPLSPELGDPDWAIYLGLGQSF